MASIGIFDSGIGGLSVFAEFRKLAPGHPVVYLADQSWAPYGERSLTQVRQRSVAITRFLIDLGCELIVVACNSASAAALHHLREVFPGVLFVGMEPAVKPAASQSPTGVIGVLATDATFQGELYASVVDRHSNGAAIVEQACPGLAASIERFGVDAEETLTLVAQYVAPLRAAGVDTLVLGCTHYPFVIDAIRAGVGPDVEVIDPAPAVARQVLRLMGTPTVDGETSFLTTGDANVLSEQIYSLLGDRTTARHIALASPGVLPTRFEVVVGDLTRQAVDAMVNAANTHLQHGGGVAAALVTAGGSIIQQESDQWIERNGPLAPGGAAVTSAGSMPSQNVIHVAGPVYRDGQDNEGLLRSAVSGALQAAESVGATSIAFPAISAGIYGYPVAAAAAVLADEVVRWAVQHPAALEEVRLVALDTEVASHFSSGLAASLARH